MSEYQKLRPITFYLPQFHPIAENNEWWGEGFTEWTNVTKAKPLFPGHYQPHLPADLGFYDLRLAETRKKQADLAKEHGIYGFCYYHYWFNGKRVLERPFNEVLASGEPDFPFMLCWANENWSRIWDGSEKNVLLKQNYSATDDIEHIESLIPAFKDSRYIKVEGKPVFALYRSSVLPDVSETIRRWRNEAKKEGLELYLCRVESFGEGGEEFLNVGFDAAINFEPFSARSSAYIKQVVSSHINNKTRPWFLKYALSSKEERGEMVNNLYRIRDYVKYVEFIKSTQKVPYKQFPCVAPMWDNTSRRKTNPTYFINSSPQKYKEWLEFEVDRFTPYSAEENFIFVNAWNEWAEGNHLEPCQKWGRQYLEATKEVLERIILSQ